MMPCATTPRGLTFAFVIRDTLETGWVAKILTSVQQQVTIAVLMLCATTPKDLTTALVIRDTTETDGIVKILTSVL